MRNPLTKRLPRELRNNMGKYLGIFLLMAGSIALVSGFLLAASSINVIMSTMRDDYVIEDARFTLDYEATDEQLDAARDAAQGYGGAEVVPITSVDAALEQVDGSAAAREATVRAYAHRTQVDVAAYAQGRAPQTASAMVWPVCCASWAMAGVAMCTGSACCRLIRPSCSASGPSR